MKAPLRPAQAPELPPATPFRGEPYSSFDKPTQPLAEQKPINERPIPMWLAPIAGPIFGAILGFTAMGKHNHRGGEDLGVDLIYIIAGFAAAGFIAGLVVMLLDFLRSRKP